MQPDTTTAISIPETLCFRYVVGHDTAYTTLTIRDNAVSGPLVYKWYQKDWNQGEVSGRLEGNIIRGDYRFMSEGIESVREVIFKLENDRLIEGYGQLDERNSKVIFRNPSQVTFPEGERGIVFHKVDCTQYLL